MKTGELIFLIICGIASINALFMAVYVWFQREKNIIPSIISSSFLVLVGYRISKLLLHDLKDDFQIDFHLPVVYYIIPTLALVGPLLYFYIRSVSQRAFQLRWVYLLHAIPFMLILIIDLLIFRSVDKLPASHSYYILYCIQISMVLLQFLIYLVYSYVYSSRLIDAAKDSWSPKETINPYWIRNIVIAISLLWIIEAMSCFEAYSGIYIFTVVIEPFFYSVFIYVILFLELRSRRITTINNFTSRIAASAIPLQEMIKYKSLLLDYIQENEVYKDQDITLGKLARQLTMTPHLLSKVINEQCSGNFNDFINSYRIETAKKMLTDPEMKNFTIASIAFDSGFNTLSAFNVAFKKFTGVTPSQFRLKDK